MKGHFSGAIRPEVNQRLLTHLEVRFPNEMSETITSHATEPNVEPRSQYSLNEREGHAKYQEGQLTKESPDHK